MKSTWDQVRETLIIFGIVMVAVIGAGAAVLNMMNKEYRVEVQDELKLWSEFGDDGFYFSKLWSEEKPVITETEIGWKITAKNPAR